MPFMLYLSPKAGSAAVRFFEWLEENLPEERYPGTPSAEEPLSNAEKIARESPLTDVLARHGLLPATRFVREKKNDDLQLAEHVESLLAPEPDEAMDPAADAPSLVEIDESPTQRSRQPVARDRSAQMAMATRQSKDAPERKAKPVQPASAVPTRAADKPAEAEWWNEHVMLVASGLGGCTVLLGATAWLVGRSRRKRRRRAVSSSSISGRGRSPSPTIVVPDPDRPRDRQPVRRWK